MPIIRRKKTTCYCIWGCLLVVLDVAGCGTVVVFFLLMMGILNIWIDNKHLYCCILLLFFLHALLTMHGQRNIKYLHTVASGWIFINSYYLICHISHETAIFRKALTHSFSGDRKTLGRSSIDRHLNKNMLCFCENIRTKNN